MPNEIETSTPLEEILQSEGPYYELLMMADESPHGVTGHVCNQCGRDVSTQPCPEHAPREVPGLTLVGCDATPRHWLWTYAGDYYDGPCYRCESIWLYQREEERNRCRHGRWRNWGLTNWVVRVLYRLRLSEGRCDRMCGQRKGFCLQYVIWRGGRVGLAVRRG